MLKTGAEKTILEGGWNPTFSRMPEDRYAESMGFTLQTPMGTEQGGWLPSPYPAQWKEGSLRDLPILSGRRWKGLVSFKCLMTCQSPLICHL